MRALVTLVRRAPARLHDAAAQFLARPASAAPLAALRIGLAAVLLAQAVALAPGLLELYGPLGLVQWPIVHALVPHGVPRISWVAEALAPLGIGPTASVRVVFLTYVAGLGCLLAGWHTRVAAAVAWLTHLMLAISGHAVVYGVDTFAHFALFYCLLLPVGHAASLDRQAGRVPAGPTFAARLGLRLLQLHLCIVYLAAGLSKAVSAQWWSGEALWRALLQPALGQFDFSWLAAAPWAARLACWATILIELGYPLFIWLPWTRRFWALLTVGLHVGIGVTMGLWSFSGVMIVLNVAAFLVPASGSGDGVRG